MKPEKTIEKNRKELDKITKELVRLVARRNKLVMGVGKAKKKMKIKVTDNRRENIVLKKARSYSRKAKVDSKLMEKIMKLLVRHAKKLQAR